MKKLLYTLSTLCATLAYFSANAQATFPDWWEEVDYMHFWQQYDPDGPNQNKLVALVHPGEEDESEEDDVYEEHVISEYPLDIDTTIKTIAENKSRQLFYIAGINAAGNFIQTYHITPDMQLAPLQALPEATPTDKITGLAISEDDQYLYASTDNNEILVYQITPRNTLQLIQTASTPQGKAWEDQLLITTPFADHNFLVSLSYDGSFILPAQQPPVPGTRGGRWRTTQQHYYRTLPSGRQVRRITIYQLEPNGHIDDKQVFDYAQHRDHYTNRPLIRPFGISEIAIMKINELPITVGKQQLYELVVEIAGSRYAITDIFHLDPLTGSITLSNSKKQNLDEYLEDENESEDENYKIKYASYVQDNFTLPEQWRKKIGKEIIRALAKKERSLNLPGGGTLHDVDKMIAEFATGTTPEE